MTRQDMSYVERIALLCAENGITIRFLEKELALGNGTIRRWNDSSPAISKIIKVAQYFNVSIDWLCGLSESRSRDYAVAAICNYIGMNENAVDLLHHLKSDPHWISLSSHFLSTAAILSNSKSVNATFGGIDFETVQSADQ